MKISTLVVGPIMTNCYILCDEAEKVCLVIDPGEEPNRIELAIRETGCQLQAICLTHGHSDHCGGVRRLLQFHPDVPVYIHAKDAVDDQKAGSALLKFPRLSEHNQRYYQEGDTLTLGSLTISVLETPGHSGGSVCLLAEDALFCGDTLFYTSCGRTDLSDGSYEQILTSLARLARLEGNYAVYPGHEQDSSLEFERHFNPYIRQALTLIP